MAESVEVAKLSDELGPVDYLMHRGEANPRTRSGIMALELLDTTPDWERFRTRFENASRRVLRLRQKVVVRRCRRRPRVGWWIPTSTWTSMCAGCGCPGPAPLREVFDLAEVILQSPMDISRPLWTATLVEGLADGKAATLLHVSHAVTDGVGGVEMFAEIYDVERDPPPRPTPPQPIPQDLTPNDLMRQGLNRLHRPRQRRRGCGGRGGVGGRAGGTGPRVHGGGSGRLRDVRRAGDEPRRRAVAAAAPA